MTASCRVYGEITTFPAAHNIARNIQRLCEEIFYFITFQKIVLRFLTKERPQYLLNPICIIFWKGLRLVLCVFKLCTSIVGQSYQP